MRYDASDAGSLVLDSTIKSSATGQLIDHHRSTSSLNPNLNKDDNDSINDKSEIEAQGMENDTKSITSNKSSGSQQDNRYMIKSHTISIFPFNRFIIYHFLCMSSYKEKWRCF